MSAVKCGHWDIVGRLLDVDKVRENAAAMGNQALRWAAAHCHLATVDRLLAIDVVRENAAAMDNKTLKSAARDGNVDMVDRLLEIPEVKANVEASNYLTLIHAIINGHLADVNNLLNRPEDLVGVDDAYGMLECSVFYGHLDIFDRLLTFNGIGSDTLGLTVSTNYDELLLSAACFGRLAIVNRLLVFEIQKVLTKDCMKDAMKLAAANGHSDIVRRLARTIWPGHGVSGIPRNIQNFEAGGTTIKAHIECASVQLSVNTLFRNHEQISRLLGFNSNESPYGDDTGPWGKIKGYLNGPGR